jgi:hypothetical protein
MLVKDTYTQNTATTAKTNITPKNRCALPKTLIAIILTNYKIKDEI